MFHSKFGNPYVGFVMYLLFFVLLTGGWKGCGNYTQADPTQLAMGVPTEMADQVPADWRDFLAIMIGWNSYEDMRAREGQPLYFSYQEQYSNGYQSDILVAGVVTISPNGAINRLEQIGQVTVMEGELLPVHVRTAASIITEAMNFAPMSEIWADPSGRFYVILKGVAQANGTGAWFIGVVDRTGNSILQLCSQAGSCGSYASAKSAGEIAELMRASGYQRLLSPSEVDPKVKDFFLKDLPKILAAGSGGGYFGASKAWLVNRFNVIGQPVMVPAFGITTLPYQVICPDCPAWDELPQE